MLACAKRMKNDLDQLTQDELLTSSGLIGYGLELGAKKAYPDPWAYDSIKNISKFAISSVDVFLSWDGMLDTSGHGENAGANTGKIFVPGSQSKDVIDGLLPTSTTATQYYACSRLAELIIGSQMRGVVAPIPRDVEAFLTAACIHILKSRNEHGGRLSRWKKYIQGVVGSYLQETEREDVVVRERCQTYPDSAVLAKTNPELNSVTLAGWQVDVLTDAKRTLKAKMDICARAYEKTLTLLANGNGAGDNADPRNAFTADLHPNYFLACILYKTPSPSDGVQHPMLRAHFQFQLWANLRTYWRLLNKAGVAIGMNKGASAGGVSVGGLVGGYVGGGTSSAANSSSEAEEALASGVLLKHANPFDEFFPSREEVMDYILGIDRTRQFDFSLAEVGAEMGDYDLFLGVQRLLGLRLPLPEGQQQEGASTKAEEATSGVVGAAVGVGVNTNSSSSIGAGPSVGSNTTGSRTVRKQYFELLPDIAVYQRVFRYLVNQDGDSSDNSTGTASCSYSLAKVFGTDSLPHFLLFSLIEMLSHPDESDRMDLTDETSPKAKTRDLTDESDIDAALKAHVTDAHRTVFKKQAELFYCAQMKQKINNILRDEFLNTTVPTGDRPDVLFFTKLQTLFSHNFLEIEDADLRDKLGAEVVDGFLGVEGLRRVPASSVRVALLEAMVVAGESEEEDALQRDNGCSLQGERLWLLAFGALPVGRIYADQGGADTASEDVQALTRSYVGKLWADIFDAFDRIGGKIGGKHKTVKDHTKIVRLKSFESADEDLSAATGVDHDMEVSPDTTTGSSAAASSPNDPATPPLKKLRRGADSTEIMNMTDSDAVTTEHENDPNESPCSDLRALAELAYARMPKNLPYHKTTKNGYNDENPSHNAMGFRSQFQLLRAVVADATSARKFSEKTLNFLNTDTIVTRYIRQHCLRQLTVFWPNLKSNYLEEAGIKAERFRPKCIADESVRPSGGVGSPLEGVGAMWVGQVLRHRCMAQVSIGDGGRRGNYFSPRPRQRL